MAADPTSVSEPGKHGNSADLFLTFGPDAGRVV